MPCFVVCPRTAHTTHHLAHTTHHLALQSLKMFYHSPANIFFILPVQHWYFHQSNFKTAFLLYTTSLKHPPTPTSLLYLSPISSLSPFSSLPYEACHSYLYLPVLQVALQMEGADDETQGKEGTYEQILEESKKGKLLNTLPSSQLSVDIDTRHGTGHITLQRAV